MAEGSLSTSPKTSLQECQHVLERLGEVYQHEAQAKRAALSPEARLRFHQEHSQKVMDDLQQWMSQQLEQKRVEPNSGLGQAFNYMLKHWDPLTLFLRQAGAPLDNNICERALKMAILHRKNSHGLQDPERRPAGRYVHELDPHLPTLRRQSTGLSQRTPTPRQGSAGASDPVVTLELQAGAPALRYRLRQPA